MKILVVTSLALLFFGCASTENEDTNSDDPFSNIAHQAPATHQDKLGGKEAAIGVALATTLGVISKDNFECTKACEQALKESIANGVKNK